MKAEIVQLWVKQAEHDLDMATKVMEIKGYSLTAFLCQQAVEKYLKALYIKEKQQNPPRTHYLDKLGQELNASSHIQGLLFELSEDYMLTRYPDVAWAIPAEEYTREDAERRLQAARKIIQWVKMELAGGRE